MAGRKGRFPVQSRDFMMTCVGPVCIGTRVCVLSLLGIDDGETKLTE
jgi:hypothetical protein